MLGPVPSICNALIWLDVSDPRHKAEDDAVQAVPLIFGAPDTVHAAGVSVRNRTVNEEDVAWDDYEDHEVDWPMRDVEERKD
jgi:uncharacterized cysteine cluster protein YcgN (CxxCxxCC family)